MSGITDDLPIIIAGAGIVGLSLAQALKQAGIPFCIYEKDNSLDANSGGWAITIHWALSAFEKCLPSDLFNRLQDIQVDPEQGRNDTGKFLFLDLATAKPRFEIPPSKRMRVNRRLLRQLLAEGIDIDWGKGAIGFEAHDEAIEVKLTDGTIRRGCLLVGADGGNSRLRKAVVGEEAGQLQLLDVKCLGVTAKLTAAQVKPLREIDPLLFQGCHPQTNNYLWYSIVSTPEINGSASGREGNGEYYEAQVIISWRPQPNFTMPSNNDDRLKLMKEKASVFENRLRTLVHDLPSDSHVLDIKLADWPTQSWNNHAGRFTLTGDAAHAMTMYRGEAFNHGITDAALLAEQLGLVQKGESSLENAIIRYETEMRQRTHDAVLLSRQACLDAHDWKNLSKESPLVSKRARVQKD